MNAAYLSALAALAGSAIGAMASFATTWLTQHFQDRVQRLTRENSRRETLFGQFIDEASKQFANALTHSLDDPAELVPLYAVLGKLRLFASATTLAAADAVVRQVIATYDGPNQDFRTRHGLEGDRVDLLRSFTLACRDELTGVR